MIKFNLIKEITKSEQREDFAPGSPVTPLRTLQYVSVCKLLILEEIKFNKIKRKFGKIKNKKVKVFESKDLNINSKKVYKFLDWSPSLSIENAVNLTVEWYRAFKKKQDLFYLTKIQILNYFKKMDSI